MGTRELGRGVRAAGTQAPRTAAERREENPAGLWGCTLQEVQPLALGKGMAVVSFCTDPRKAEGGT